ncbi:hypothetical protein [Ralstonia phage RP13]|nr:hypothetical protein [Ralstonia phage RP13]
MSVVLKDTQQVTLHANLVDRAGNVATVAQPPVWATSDAAVASVVAAADGMSAVVKAGKVGSATVTVTEAGLNRTIDITVVGGDATNIEITADAPVDQPVDTAAPVAADPAAPAAA